jgi:hypothetical protein
VQHQRNRLLVAFQVSLICSTLWGGCSPKSVVYKDRVFVIPNGRKGYLAVIYGARKNQLRTSNDATGREVLTIPPIGILCLGDPRPKTIVGINEYRVGSATGPFLTIGKPNEALQGPQVWWRSTGVYFPSHLGMRTVQSTSEPGVVHYETFYVSEGGVPVSPSDEEDRAFNERMSEHCGL